MARTDAPTGKDRGGGLAGWLVGWLAGITNALNLHNKEGGLHVCVCVL
jgi:hypothetical protein